jgi:hypothetical protein
LQQQKFVSEKKIDSVAILPTISSLFFTMLSIVFLGYPGFPESSIMKNLSNSSVDYKTCDITTDKLIPAIKTQVQFCKFNQFSYQLIFLYFLAMQIFVTYYNLHNKRDLLIINHALDIFSEKLPENDESQQ